MTTADRQLWRRADHGWLKAVLDTAPEGVLVESQERVVYANQLYAQMLGYRSSRELIGRSISELIGAPDVDRLLGFGRDRQRGAPAPESYDFAALRRDGRMIHVRARVAVSVVDHQTCISTFVQPYDATDPQETGEIGGVHQQLSSREREVMHALLNGDRIKEIAVELGISEKTIATHRARMLRKDGPLR